MGYASRHHALSPKRKRERREPAADSLRC